MKRLFIGALVTAVAAAFATPLLIASPASAAPLFTQCPAIGQDTGCGILITINPGGGLTVQQDPSQGPYDGVEDTLIGVQNNSGVAQPKVHLTTNADAFGFDGDGICSFSGWTGSSGCPYGSTGYEGPNTSFSNISSDLESGDVNFTQRGGLPNGSHAFFSLEEALTAVSFGGVSCPLAHNDDHYITGSHPGSYQPNDGKTWCFENATIGGAINISRNSTVYILTSTLSGGVYSNGGNAFFMCGDTSNTATSVQLTNANGFQLVGAPDVGCKGNNLGGSLVFQGNHSGVEAAGNTLHGSISDLSNVVGANAQADPDGGPAANELEGNTVVSLNCSGNNPAPVNNGQANTVSGSRSGQCVKTATFTG